MAIVRTTTKDQTTGSAPPQTAKSQRGNPPARPGVRPGAPRVAAQQTRSPKAFLQDTWIELHRVKWPTRAEVQAGSIVTVLLLFFFAIYIFGLDFAAEKLFQMIGLYGDQTPSP